MNPSKFLHLNISQYTATSVSVPKMTNISYGYERWVDGSAENTEVVNAGLHALIFTFTRPHIEYVPCTCFNINQHFAKI